MSETLGSFIHRLSGVYRDPQRVLRDAEVLLSSPLGTHLRPATEPLMLNDGSSTPPVLLLRGTLPMTYRGVTYNLPIDLYLPPPYPQRPPTVFIRPISTMAIKPNHRHVGLDGRIYLPYLHEWKAETHELRELAVWMSSLFGSEPPCYSKPAGSSGRNPTNGHSNGHPPPAYAQATTAQSTSSYNTAAQSHTSSHASFYAASSSASSYNTATSSATTTADDERRKAFEKEIIEANLAAEAARKAAAEETQLLSEQKRLKHEHEQTLIRMRSTATSKAQFQIQSLFAEMKDELRIELKQQKQLEFGKDEINKLLKAGEERKVELTKGNKEVEESIEGLETWLGAVKEEQSKAEEEADSSVNNADLIALPADTHSAQMLALSAENAAIDDCIYFLDRALVRGSIGLVVFLKEVRRLSKRQFLVKAHLIKISQSCAAEQR